MLKCISCKRRRTYVGYTSNLKERLVKHNNSKGAKYTKGNKWIIIYKKKFHYKAKAMSFEYKLKKNLMLRNKIYLKF